VPHLKTHAWAYSSIALHKKSHAQQCGDMFKSNLQEPPLRTFRIPPTAVGGWFRSSLQLQEAANGLGTS